MDKLDELALIEVQNYIRIASNSTDVVHLKEDVFEFLEHLENPEEYQKPDGMDIARLHYRFIKLLEHCESIEINLRKADKWVDAVISVNSQKE